MTTAYETEENLSSSLDIGATYMGVTKSNGTTNR